MFSIEHDVVTLLVSDFSIDKIHKLMECNKTIMVNSTLVNTKYSKFRVNRLKA